MSDNIVVPWGKTKVELGDICELIVDCEHKTAPRQDVGHPSIRTPNIGRGYFILDNVYRVSEETYKTWTRRAVPLPGDLIMAREAPVGNVAIIPDGLQPCLGQRTLLIRCDKSKADPSFLNYLLNGPEVQSTIQGMTNGATVSHLNMEDVRTLPVPEPPPLPVQRRIGAILGAYDDLIENNLRRIKILEEMAQSLYREWFVNFRFPVHEKHGPRPASNEACKPARPNTPGWHPSPLGPIPSGWNVRELGTLTTCLTKGTTPTTLGKEFQEDGFNFFKVEAIDEDGGIAEGKLAKIDKETHSLLKRSQLAEGDILFSIAGAIGRVALVPKRLLPANTNQALAIIRVTDEAVRAYAHFWVRLPDFQNFSLGRVVQTAQANVSLGILKSAPVILPAETVIRLFYSRASDLLRAKENLREQVNNLRQTRDLLLPKLISGELIVTSLKTAEEYKEAATS